MFFGDPKLFFIFKLFPSIKKQRPPVESESNTTSDELSIRASTGVEL